MQHLCIEISGDVPGKSPGKFPGKGRGGRGGGGGGGRGGGGVKGAVRDALLELLLEEIIDVIYPPTTETPPPEEGGPDGPGESPDDPDESPVDPGDLGECPTDDVDECPSELTASGTRYDPKTRALIMDLGIEFSGSVKLLKPYVSKVGRRFVYTPPGKYVVKNGRLVVPATRLKNTSQGRVGWR